MTSCKYKFKFELKARCLSFNFQLRLQIQNAAEYWQLNTVQGSWQQHTTTHCIVSIWLYRSFNSLSKATWPGNLFEQQPCSTFLSQVTTRPPITARGFHSRFPKCGCILFCPQILAPPDANLSQCSVSHQYLSISDSQYLWSEYLVCLAVIITVYWKPPKYQVTIAKMDLLLQ